MTAPAPNAHLRLDSHVPRQMQQLEITTLVNDDLGATRVDILVDGTLQASLNTAPYRAWWMLETGEHRLVAVAVDRAGKRWESEPIVVTVEE